MKQETLVRKVEEKKRKASEVNEKVDEPKKQKKISKEAGKAKQAKVCAATFEEDNNYVDMATSGMNNEFLSDEESEGSEEYEIEELSSQNNNANVQLGCSNQVQNEFSVSRSTSPLHRNDQTTSSLEPSQQNCNGPDEVENAKVMERLELIQSFMVQQGLIDVNMTNKELRGKLEKQVKPCKVPAEASPINNQRAKAKGQKEKPANRKTGKDLFSNSSTSEVTIYRRAIQQLSEEINDQIENYFSKIRVDTSDANKRDSNSSEEAMDTSDETIENVVNKNYSEFIADPYQQNEQQVKEKKPQEEAEEAIRDAENVKARMLNVPGEFTQLLANSKNLNVSVIDQDYQMIDSHVEEVVRKKVLNMEYVDFSKLIPTQKMGRDDDLGQRLEIVNRNGQSYLSPLSERDRVNIGSYAKWKQAFRVFSNILTTKYPDKAPELLQYGHTIHNVSCYLIISRVVVELNLWT